MLQKDYQSLELELARSRVSVNRVAVAAASEWKEDSDKVIPVKQWVEERKYLQGEMRQLQVSRKIGSMGQCLGRFIDSSSSR